MLLWHCGSIIIVVAVAVVVVDDVDVVVVVVSVVVVVAHFLEKTITERKALVGHFVTTTTLHPKLVPESRDLLTSA